MAVLRIATPFVATILVPIYAMSATPEEEP